MIARTIKQIVDEKLDDRQDVMLFRKTSNGWWHVATITHEVAQIYYVQYNLYEFEGGRQLSPVIAYGGDELIVVFTTDPKGQVK